MTTSMQGHDILSVRIDANDVVAPGDVLSVNQLRGKVMDYVATVFQIGVPVEVQNLAATEFEQAILGSPSANRTLTEQFVREREEQGRILDFPAIDPHFM